MKELGEDGNNVLCNTFWAPDLPYGRERQDHPGLQGAIGDASTPDYFGQGYCWMKTLELAVEGTRSLEDQEDKRLFEITEV